MGRGCFLRPEEVRAVVMLTMLVVVVVVVMVVVVVGSMHFLHGGG